MASLGHKLMVYLGLSDEEYDYDDYDEGETRPQTGTSRPPVAAVRSDVEAEEVGGGIRTLTRDESARAANSEPQVLRPVNQEKQVVHIVTPSHFSDAQEIADRIKDSQPVIVNLQMANRELARRMIDFCSGATYALGGRMEKVADQVFLMTPSNVSVSAEERRRLTERGLFQQ